MKKFHDGVKQKKEGVAEACRGFDSNHSGKTQSRWKTGGFLRASTLHTFCFVSHLVLLHFLGSAVSDVPQKALLRTSWTCSGRLQLLSREEAEDHRGAAAGSSGGADEGPTQRC